MDFKIVDELKILEMSQAAYPDGRRPLKAVLHEIYPNETLWNKNGITYLEKYVRDNAESVKGMPLCAEFIDDDKVIPFGHGLTGYKDGMPIFEDSVQIGTFLDWKIEDIDIDGTTKRCLCADGYVNEARYPNFVDWMQKKIANGETIFGSIEFVGTKENNGQIIYDGGWKEKGRIPMIYDYSGYCFLSVTPSDNAAMLLELNQAKKLEMEEDATMNEEMKNVISEFKSEVLSAINDQKNVELNEKITGLENTVSELNSQIAELNSTIEAKDAEIATLTENAETVKTENEAKVAELNSQIEELNATCENVRKELNELKEANRIAELNSALSKYSDEQKEYAKDEIEAFKANPFDVEINSITEKIDAASYRKLMEENEKKQKELEINSAKNDFDDIMAAVDPIVNDDKNVEDFDVFA